VVKIIEGAGPSRYLVIMAENIDIKDTNQSVGYQQDTLDNFLASALDMEDEVSNSVYRDYMSEKNWPKSLPPDVFKNIREYLNILMEETQNHRKIILGLMQKYGKANQPE
jgi:hypothetical protein